MTSLTDLDELIEAVDDGAEGYIYTIKLRRSDGKMYWYVGSVSSGIRGLKKRIRSHKRLNGECSAPVKINGREMLLGKRDDIRKSEYEFVSVEDVSPVSDNNPRYLREIERQRAIDVALENKTRNVLGGK